MPLEPVSAEPQATTGGAPTALETSILGGLNLGGEPAAPAANKPAVVAPEPAAPRGRRGATKLEEGILSGLTPEPAKAPAPAPVEKPVAPAAPEPASVPDPTKPPELPPVAPEPDGVKLPIEDAGTPDAPVVDPDIDPKDKAAYRIKELKTENHQIKTAVEAERQARTQAEARIKELEGLANEAQTLKDKLASYDKEMSIVRLEQTQQFQDAVTKPLDSAVKDATKLAAKYSINEDALFAALEDPDADAAEEKLNELISGMDVTPRDTLAIFGLRDKVQPVLAKRAELYKNSESALRELQASSEKEVAAKAAARAEERRAAIPVVVDKMVRWLPEIKDVVEEVSKATEAVDPDSLEPQHKVFNHMAGHVLAKLGNKYLKLQAERDELLDEVSKYRNAKPNPGAFASSGGEGKPKDLLTGIMQGLGMQ